MQASSPSDRPNDLWTDNKQFDVMYGWNTCSAANHHHHVVASEADAVVLVVVAIGKTRQEIYKETVGDTRTTTSCKCDTPDSIPARIPLTPQ